MEPEGSSSHSQQPPPGPLSWAKLINSLPQLQLFNIHFNIILPPNLGSSKLSPSLRSPHPNPVRASPLPPIRATWPAYLILLHLVTRIIFGDE